MSPTCRASNPPSQRPHPAGGGSSKAARMRRSCSSWYCLGLPLRDASRRPDKPACAKRPRHLLTVAGRAPTRSATALLLSPSAMARITSARNAMRRSVFAAPSQPLKVARCSSVNITSAALITAGYHLRQFTQLGTSQINRHGAPCCGNHIDYGRRELAQSTRCPPLLGIWLLCWVSIGKRRDGHARFINPHHPRIGNKGAVEGFGRNYLGDETNVCDRRRLAMAKAAARGVFGKQRFHRLQARTEPMLNPGKPLTVADLQHVGEVVSNARHDQRVRVGDVDQCEPAHPGARQWVGRQQRRLRIRLVEIFENG